MCTGLSVFGSQLQYPEYMRADYTDYTDLRRVAVVEERQSLPAILGTGLILTAFAAAVVGAALAAGIVTVSFPVEIGISDSNFHQGSSSVVLDRLQQKPNTVFHVSIDQVN